jgi:hypothetical protein
LPPGRCPFLAEHVVGHVEAEFGDRSGFELELDLILDGLERLRDEEAHPQIGGPRDDGAGGEPTESPEGTSSFSEE